MQKQGTNHRTQGTEAAGARRHAYSIAEACIELGGLSRGQLHALRKSGELRERRIGRRVVIPASAIDAFLAGGGGQ